MLIGLYHLCYYNFCLTSQWPIPSEFGVCSPWTFMVFFEKQAGQERLRTVHVRCVPGWQRRKPSEGLGLKVEVLDMEDRQMHKIVLLNAFVSVCQSEIMPRFHFISLLLTSWRRKLFFAAINCTIFFKLTSVNFLELKMWVLLQIVNSI